MSRRTEWKCDECGKRTLDYEPRQWRRVSVEITSLRGVQELSTRAELCSSECLQEWWIHQLPTPPTELENVA